jgi:hypothetical protein
MGLLVALTGVLAALGQNSIATDRAPFWCQTEAASQSLSGQHTTFWVELTALLDRAQRAIAE